MKYFDTYLQSESSDLKCLYNSGDFDDYVNQGEQSFHDSRGMFTEKGKM